MLSDVQKHFGELHVLKDINLSVRKGEVVVVLGPSGSGKSTLCRAINRLETIESGTISIDGQTLPEEGKALAQLEPTSAWCSSRSTCSRTRRFWRT